MNLAGQRKISPEDTGAIPIPQDVNYLYGVTVTTLVKPDGASTLVMLVEAGTFRAKGGTHPGLSSAAPSASVVNGNGSFKLATNVKWVMPAPKALTVVGGSATDVLTYYFY